MLDHTNFQCSRIITDKERVHEAGVFEALSEQLSNEDADRPLFDIIAGTSGGAINAALLVSYFRDNKTWNGAAERLFD
jgi:NTE family protein